MEKAITRYSFRNILDIGCGSCDFLIDLCHRNRDISCVGVDVSIDALKVAKANIKKHAFEHRITVNQTDFMSHDSLDLKNWKPDLITFMFLLHELSGQVGIDQLVSSLKKLALRFPSAQIAVCELILQLPDQLKTHPTLLAEHFFYHALSGQNVLQLNDWRNIFRDAALNIKEEIVFNFAGQAFFLLDNGPENSR